MNRTERTFTTEQIRLERRLPSYWRVTFDIPPLNIFGVLTQPRPNPKCSASPSFDRLVGAAGAFASQRALGKPAGLR
jgi:hypothetical protein